MFLCLISEKRAFEKKVLREALSDALLNDTFHLKRHNRLKLSLS